jgi:methionyl-tRNA formyltransferase
MQDLCGQLFVVYETTSIVPVYPTHHPFEDSRTNFEQKHWGTESSAIDFEYNGYLTHVENINDIINLSDLCREIDVCIVFGTRRIKATTIAMLPPVTVNLHGGDPQLYRGLDSHLWALWHRDMEGLKTCLHYLSPELDNGDIIAMKNLDISHLDHLFELRALNTDVCIQLCRIFLKSLSNNDAIMGFPQKRYGRYYSFMPTDLKDVVAKKFKSKLRSNCNAL